MAQRKGNAGSIRRSKRKRPLRRAVLVVTNGTRTENEYLSALKQFVDRSRVAVKVMALNESPTVMLKKLRGRDSDLRDYSEVFLVVDEDGEDRTDFIRQCARLSSGQPTNGPTWTAVVTRPCFETWLVAHYENVRRYTDQDGAQKHFRAVSGAVGKSLPPGFPTEAFVDAATRCHLPGDHLGDPNTLPPVPGSAMPHLLRALGLLDR